MKGLIRKRGLHWIGASMAGVLLFAAACSQVSPEPKQAAAPMEQERSKEAAPELRTAQVFDKEAYRGKLQLRYFHLKDPKVSAGDSYLVITPDGKTMLMDGGFANVGSQVSRYLDQLGVKELDILFNTHPHPDHLGGFAEVLKTKEARAYYRQSFDNSASAQFRSTMEQIERKKIPQRVLAAGDTFTLGGDVTFDVLSPKKEALNDVIRTTDDATINFYSLVVKMTYKDTSFLFPGDIYKDREAELIELYGDKLKADFAHAPHHGHTTSSSPPFVAAVSPKVTVLSNNIFSSLDILKRYEKRGDVYSTALNGNILIVSDGKQLNVVTEKDRASTK